MRWENKRRSGNVEDRRGAGGRGIGGGRGLGLGAIVIALVAWGVFGINPLTTLGLLSGGTGSVATQQAPASAPPADDRNAAFVSTVLASTEDVWRDLFSQAGSSYPAPRLVLYRGTTPTACGMGQSAMGPFYCPGDQKIYLDMDFFDTMTRQLGAPGEFARAYVVAHEVGHHVQHLLGATDRVDRLRGRASQTEQNAMSVRLELQADCYAGVWARQSDQANRWLDPGDIQSAINAAQQIGDDTLQRRSQGRVVPDSFTHGSSAQRVRWFNRGHDTGNPGACDTFSAQSL